MDRQGANFLEVCKQIREMLGANPVPLQLPIGAEDDFKGVVDLIKNIGIVWDNNDRGMTFSEVPIPENMIEEVEEYRAHLIEAVAEYDDTLLEKFFEDPNSISEDEINTALRAATIDMSIIPMMCGSAFKDKGVQTMLDAVVKFLPSPLDVEAIIGTNPDTGEEEARKPNEDEPFSALAFKIATDPFVESMDFPDPVIGLAIEPKTQKDVDKLGMALNKLAEEDPTFKVSYNEETAQTVISGMGELHLEILVDRLKREFGVECNQGAPQVNFKEAIRGTIKHREIYKKQSGGSGKFADITFEIGPGKPGEDGIIQDGLQFDNSISGGAIPKEFIPSVEKGFKVAMKNGPLAGYEVQSLYVKLMDGSFHDVDSDQLSFELAAKMAFRKAALECDPAILEPIMKIEVVTPEDYTGAIVGDLNRRRGVMEGMDARAGAQVEQHLQWSSTVLKLFQQEFLKK
eukprot:maker-scaffold1441_size41149-snap-gene-0.0 protein:Tk01192 transcript:maker-scaffold1441_size41149-snap-gene-0.0-mRNA-1 annotation:"translation elongation factor 2 (ef-2 ef-g)"